MDGAPNPYQSSANEPNAEAIDRGVNDLQIKGGLVCVAAFIVTAMVIAWNGQFGYNRLKIFGKQVELSSSTYAFVLISVVSALFTSNRVAIAFAALAALLINFNQIYSMRELQRINALTAQADGLRPDAWIWSSIPLFLVTLTLAWLAYLAKPNDPRQLVENDGRPSET